MVTHPMRRTLFKLSADSLHCRTRAVVASCMCPLRLLQPFPCFCGAKVAACLWDHVRWQVCLQMLLKIGCI